MKKIFTIALFVVGCLVMTNGCKDENAQYKPTPERTPKVPDDESRSGPSESFLPPGPDQ